MVMLVGLALLVGFVLGVLTILAVEGLGIVYLIRKLNTRLEREEDKAKKASSSLSSQQASPLLDPSYQNKQGYIWALESEKVTEPSNLDKASQDQKRKKEILEVKPVRKYAKIKDQSLYILESDGSPTEIRLKGCMIVAVSATSLSSRKWAKRYPIKVESKTSEIYHGSKTFYIYLETSWEKESWCKSLRFASCDDKEKLWFNKLNLAFHNYLTSLNTAYPLFMKPSLGFTSEPIDRSVKFDSSSSKVRQFIKKLAKKASKSCLEKAGCSSTSAREERKSNDKSHLSQESLLATGLIKTGPAVRTSNFSAEENVAPSSLSTFPNSGSSGQVLLMSDADSDDKMTGDEGSLSWNLLISRFFFDAIRNSETKKSIKARIQRTLSNMRIPSFVGELSCIGVDPGYLPPYIHGLRVLPSDMNEVWAMEFDIEYSGGAGLDIETRLEVRDLDFQTRLEPNYMEEMATDLLEDFEQLDKRFKFSERTVDGKEQQDGGDLKQDGIRRCKSSTHGSFQVSKWKSLLHSIAKQVSQIPLSLGIRIASFRGTLRLYIKPPPSDQLWFGFTSMPDIDFNLASSVGDHKFTNSHVAIYLMSKFKTAIRETLVLPNCESVCIPWMLAEKDDWVARTVAPFIWTNQEASTDPTNVNEVLSSQISEAECKIEGSKGTASSYLEGEPDKCKEVESADQPTNDSSETCASSSGSMETISDKHLQEMRMPLLRHDEFREISQEESSGFQLPSHSMSMLSERSFNMEEDDSKHKRMGTGARMLGLGKKMGEKLEEKRRHIEERSRNIVERMRGPQN